MPDRSWSLKGVELANCNCDLGCPCQFNALPTHGDCRAMTAVRIEEGRSGDVKLDGLSIAFTVAWPGPIHEGGGTWQSVIDERANPAQRAALEDIMAGRNTDPGGSIFQIFHTTVTKVLETVFRPIEVDVDYAARRGSVRIPGLLETSAETIRNPKTGAEHVVRVTLPGGFEYAEADYLSGTSRATGAITLDVAGTHAHIAHVHWSDRGVVR
jgi:hypothetical protein